MKHRFTTKDNGCDVFNQPTFVKDYNKLVNDIGNDFKIEQESISIILTWPIVTVTLLSAGTGRIPQFIGGMKTCLAFLTHKIFTESWWCRKKDEKCISYSYL